MNLNKVIENILKYRHFSCIFHHSKVVINSPTNNYAVFFVHLGLLLGPFLLVSEAVLQPVPLLGKTGFYSRKSWHEKKAWNLTVLETKAESKKRDYPRFSQVCGVRESGFPCTKNLPDSPHSFSLSTFIKQGTQLFIRHKCFAL